jgi:MFS family permease
MSNTIQNLTASGSDLQQAATEDTSVIVKLLPIIGVVFIAYLIIGLAMSVLPLHVHNGLGFSTFAVGLVAGSQFAAALFSRPWAGFFADKQGAKRAVVAGLIVAVISGALYLVSLQFVANPSTSIVILLAGRIALGIAESFIITGALSWGLVRAGADNTGKVMSWIGTALYAAYAVGAPIGTWAYAKEGFTAIALTAGIIPLVALLLVAPLRPTSPILSSARPSLTKVIGAVWMPGLGLAVSGVGFGAITTFIVLLFAQNGWGKAWLALTLLSVAFIVGRVFFGHLPDKNGAKAALFCILIEALGLALIWLAPSAFIALVGVTLVGLGYSLVYPGFGVEALRRTPPENRGLAMGAYTAFLDMSLGFASPALGLIANGKGLNAVFLVSTLVVLGSALIALRLLLSSNRNIIVKN